MTNSMHVVGIVRTDLYNTYPMSLIADALSPLVQEGILMLHFTANLTMLFTERPFLERFAAARSAGFSTVEYLFPYEYEAPHLAELLAKNQLKQVLFNLPAGDWSKGDRGIAADPARVSEFRAGVERALDYARILGVGQLNCLAGKIQSDISPDAQWQTLRENLQFAADALAGQGVKLLVEFINRSDIPGFLLHRTEQTLRLLDEVDRANVFLQYDIYHAQREEGELTATLRTHLGRIGHIQLADNPGRHQPGTGEINFPFVFEQLEKLGYQGYIGLEYVPTPDTLSSLAWLTPYNVQA
jgi:hydroxypyruvate isomerase